MGIHCYLLYGFFGLGKELPVVLAWHGSLLVRHVDGGCLLQDYFGFVFGWLAFRSRVTGVYLSIIDASLKPTLYCGRFSVIEMGFADKWLNRFLKNSRF